MASFPHIIASVRAAHRDRIDAAAARDPHRCERRCVNGLPYSLLHVGTWLAHHGCPDDEPCVGERQAGVSMAYYREGLARMDAGLLSETLEIAERAIFGGRHPLWVPLAPAAVEMVRRAA